jgi:glycosyltransferase involved in cell wall biosynthesis
VNIVLYTFPFAPQIGGLERLTENTARRLTARGHQVTVVTDTPAARPDAHPFRVLRRPALAALVAAIRRSDVVHLNGFDASVFACAAFFRRPIVWQHIDYDTVDPRGLCSRYGRSCDFRLRRCWQCLRSDHSRLGTLRALAAFAAKVIASRFVRVNLVAAAYAARRLRLPRARLVPLGADLSLFSPADAPEGSFTVLFSGRHVPAKGCDVLVRAVAICRDRGLPVRTVIAGDGPHRSSSEQLAASLSLNGSVTFTGFVADGDLVKLIQASSAVVVPSTNDEYYCLAALEAMSCGIPVIASDAGSLPEILGSSGLLFPPGNAQALADRIERVFNDADLRRKMREDGRRRARELSDEQMVGAYEDVYRGVARSSR